MADMKPRHAAALVVVGWYLMLPPTQEMLDPACASRQASLMGTLKQLTRGTDANIIQCDVESLWLDTRVSLSKWDQAREPFETLSACQAAKEKPLSEQERRSAESVARSVMEDDRQARPEAAKALPKTFIEHTFPSPQPTLPFSLYIPT